MQNLDHIRAFACEQTAQNVAAGGDATKSGEPYLAALKALTQSSEWLQDPVLAKQVFSRLETIEPQTPEARAQTAAIYMKLISNNGRVAPIPLNTAQIKISEQKTIDLPKTMLMAESAVFQRLLSKSTGQPIDLSGKASRESLTHLTNHLATGETGFVTDENAVELLLLAKEFELSELTMRCLKRLLDPTRYTLEQTVNEQQISDAEVNLRNLLKEAKTCSITISRSTSGIAHVKMGDGSKKEQWDCLKKLHDYIPVTHLELTRSRDLGCLLAFSKDNPDIVSLCLGESQGIEDAYLMQLAQNLSKISSFSIRSAPIKAIPQAICDKVLTLDCSRCRSLTRINTPNVVSLNCTGCTALTSLSAHNVITLKCEYCDSLPSISAPKATVVECCNCHTLKGLSVDSALMLNCSQCTALASISAPSATTLECIVCPAMISISAPSVVKLDCSGCRALTGISAPSATTLNCSYCMALTSISAPGVVDLNCNGCPALTSISAPSAVTLNCSNCVALTSIRAPGVITLDCRGCHVLINMSVPSAATLNCSRCFALTSLGAPNLATLDCRECHALTSINAPNAVIIECINCDALTSIKADNVQKLYCAYNDALTSISAPGVVALDCSGCRALTSISAPSAVLLDCHGCPALSNISAPNVTALDCRNCHSLTDPVKLKLFNVVRRNIILTDYRNIERLIERLFGHVANAKPRYGLDVGEEFCIKQWFIDAQQLSIPADFGSEAEKSECEEKINEFFERLVSYAAKESTLHEVDLSWFNDLRKLESPQQQMNRVIWLGSLLAGATSRENPLTDRAALQSLKAIGNLGDPFLQEGATRALFSMYETEAADRTNAWIMLKEKRADHRLLLCLFLARANINMDNANLLLDGLNIRHFKDLNVLSPILEMACLLSSGHSLTAQEREKVLRLTLKAPEKGAREKAKQFDERLNQYRAVQPMLVNACRDLLLFKKAFELKNVKDGDDLLIRHKRTCQAVFGVKEELLGSFVNAFKSQRCPNGLFTYAARLQTLANSEKVLLTDLLGKFVNGVLEHTFPENRYDLTNNKHLKRVFKGNKRLLNEWKKPLEINLEQTASLGQEPEISPGDVVKDLMRRAIENNHLGTDQELVYPTLVAVLKSNDPTQILANLTALEKRLQHTQDQFNSSASEYPADLKAELNNLQTEILCLQAIDPRVAVTEREGYLNVLLEKLPEGSEFRNDVRGMLAALKPSNSSNAKWVKIQTTEAWEDFLLMGTEVNNSCQRINGDPNFNKCLLAYMLDGKNKLMIVRDSNGKIAARSVLRILWDDKDKRPVLFMEQIYTAKADPALQRLIMEGCMEKARAMGLPLVASPSSFPNGALYMGTLSALGGPAPFEYVDALKEIQENGIFTLPTSNVIYMPDAEPS